MSESHGLGPLLEAARRGYGSVGRRQRWALLFAGCLFLAFLVTDAYAVVQLGTGDAYLDLTGDLLNLTGVLVLMLAIVLQEATQKAAVCQGERFRLRFAPPMHRLHEMLAAFPVLALVAAALVSAGTAVNVLGGSGPAAWIVALLTGSCIVGWAIWLVGHTTGYLYRQALERTEAAVRAEGEATEAQLRALQAQMNPHFLFNALNTVTGLVRTDARAAEATVENLARVLRRTLDRSRRVLATVEDEIEYVDAYLAVERQRFGDRLRVEWRVAPETLCARLPTMTLQPLVENALRHGVGARLEGGEVTVGARVEDEERLVLTVVDDGPGLARRHREGTGLANLRERLAALYGERGRLEVEDTGSGTRATVVVPLGFD